MKRLALSILLLAGCSTAAFAEPPAQPVHMPVERTVKLTDDEINVTIQMMDECVRAKGLLCAEAAIVMAKKLRAAQQPEAPKAPPKK
jgi:hypothetical protein